MRIVARTCRTCSGFGGALRSLDPVDVLRPRVVNPSSRISAESVGMVVVQLKRLVGMVEIALRERNDHRASARRRHAVNALLDRGCGVGTPRRVRARLGHDRPRRLRRKRERRDCNNRPNRQKNPGRLAVNAWHDNLRFHGAYDAKTTYDFQVRLWFAIFSVRLSC